MRAAAAQMLGVYPGFHSVEGTAERTTLPPRSVGMVTAAQAFHWFDRTLARTEIARILKPGGWLALIWNERRTTATPFLREYEMLSQDFGIDYRSVREQHPDLSQIRRFVGQNAVFLEVLAHQQKLGYASLEGRLLSSSYAPELGHPAHRPMVAKLREIFDRHEHGGTVSLDYDTHVYYAQLSS